MNGLCYIKREIYKNPSPDPDKDRGLFERLWDKEKMLSDTVNSLFSYCQLFYTMFSVDESLID